MCVLFAFSCSYSNSISFSNPFLSLGPPGWVDIGLAPLPPPVPAQPGPPPAERYSGALAGRLPPGRRCWELFPGMGGQQPAVAALARDSYDTR